MPTAEGIFPKIGNDPLFNSEVNIFKGHIIQIYTGNALDFSVTGGGANQTFEMTAITSANLVSATYIKISITAMYQGTGTSNPRCDYKIETKEIGGAYSDSLPTIKMIDDGGRRVATFVWYHTLTAGEKTNGVQVKLTTSAPATGDGNQRFENVQIYNVPV